MKVILIQDVKALGKKGEIVNVNDGYARNFLLKTKKGVQADGKNLNDLKLQKSNQEKIARENLEAAKKLSEELAKGQIVLSIKVGDGGKTFGSVSSKEIAVAVKEQMNLESFKKEALDFLNREYPSFAQEDKHYLTRIEEESEEYFNDSWSPNAMVAGMVNGLI